MPVQDRTEQYAQETAKATNGWVPENGLAGRDFTMPEIESSSFCR